MAYYHVSRERLDGSVTELVPDYYNRLATHGLAPEFFEQFWKEMVFEKIRRMHHPDKVSRLWCVYMVDSIEQASAYKRNHAYAQNGVIYEIEPVDGAIVNKFDMNLVNCNGFVLNSIVDHAGAYYSGKHSPTPFWECLCDGKAKIIKEVT